MGLGFLPMFNFKIAYKAERRYDKNLKGRR